MRRLALALLLVLLGAAAASPAVAAEDETPARLVLLGTAGGPIPRLERAQSATALVVGGQTYLIDAGDGVLRQMAASRLGLGSVRALFLTHHHIDHIGDVPVLMIDRWLLANAPPLPVYGPPGTKDLVSGTLKAFQPVALAPVSIGGPTKPPLAEAAYGRDLVADLDEPQLIYTDEHVRVSAVGVDHYHYSPGSPEARFSRSYAYRIEAGGKSYVFSGDTGPSARLAKLARGADYLICEVISLAMIERQLRAFPGFTPAQIPALMQHMAEDHLTGDQIGRLAAEAGVGKLILTHLAPGADGETDMSDYVRGIADHFAGEVIIGKDLGEY